MSEKSSQENNIENSSNEAVVNGWKDWSDQVTAYEAEGKTPAVSDETKDVETPSVDDSKERESTIESDNSNLNKAVESVKEGDVSSLASRKVVYGAARDGMVAKQEKAFVAKQEADKLDRELENGVEEALEKGTEQPEVPAEYLEAKNGWKEARDRALSLEKEYQDKYREHVLTQSKGWRGLSNLPRRMLGLQPKLTRELQSLQGAAFIARREHREASKKLKDIKLTKEGSTVEANAKLYERYQRMLGYHLTVGVGKKRLEAQKEAVSEAWGGNKFKPVLDRINKYKYARIGAMTVGYAVLAGATGGIGAAAVGGGAYLGRIAAAMGMGAGVGMGGRQLFVKPLQEKLQTAEQNVGKDIFEKDLLQAEKETENLIFSIDSTERRVRTAAMASGLAVGLASSPEADTGSGEVDSPAEDIPQGGNENTETPTKPDETPESPNKDNETRWPSEKDDSRAVDDIPKRSPVNPAMQGVTEQDIEDIESAPEPNNDGTLDSETDIQSEIISPVVESPTISHTVVKDDNVWNVLEGKGPDVNPVGGKSEVLQGMALEERHAALDKLVEYYESHPQEAIEAGVVKSNGNINLIYPDEQLNISMFDDKLREILGMEAGQPEAQPQTEVPESLPEDIPEDIPEPEAQPQTQNQSPNPTPAEPANNLQEPSEGVVIQPGIEESSLNESETTFNSGVGEAQPNGAVQETVAENSQVVKDYVADVEKSSGLMSFFGDTGVSGSFEGLKSLSLDQFRDLAADNENLNNNLSQLGVSREGFERWGEKLEDSIAKNPAEGSETVGNYVGRLATGTRIA